MARSNVEEIKEKLDILEVVGGYVELTKAGKHYKARSPFTNEKTPSFYVSPDRGMYYCFSSQKGGDMFTFVQEMEGVDFKGALKILAEKAHVELVPEDPKKRDARETQYALLEEATKYFFDNRESSNEITNYVLERGVNDDSIHTWRIGYAKDEWRALRTHLAQKGFSDEQMFKAGLIKQADGGKEPYDVFRDRVMFPLFDPSGRVIAFSGRTLKKEDGVPKYVNSPETELFQKSEVLYGYDKAKNGIRHYDFSLVVEGQFDVVLAHQAGYTNTVAVSGTALTPHHIMLLLRLSTNVVLALDSDRAGISAIKRSSVPMLERGMNVKVAQMPEGKDPADIVKEDKTELKQYVGKSEHVIEFLLKVLKNTAKDERAYKLQVREEVLPLLVAIDNRIDREHFEGVVAKAIDATRDGVHHEVERTAERMKKERGNEGDSREVEEIHERAGKRTALEHHIGAMYRVLGSEYVWLTKEMKYHLQTIVGEDEKSAFWSKKADIPAGEIFRFEHHLEQIREKQLIQEVGEALTLYAHLVARERLSTLKAELKDAERNREDDRIIEILGQAKEMEKLLQNHIIIEKLVNK